MSGRCAVLARAALALAVTLAGCSVVAGYPDTAEEQGNGLCHDGADNDLDGAPDCVDPGCEGFCPGEADVDRADLTECFEGGGFQFAPARDNDERLVCVAFSMDPQSCEAGQVLFPGAPECREITELGCGDAEVPDDAIHVSPGASGGDGTAESPYGSIADALAAADPGATVTLDAGRYEEAVVLDEPVTLLGSCSGTSRVLADGGNPAIRIAADAVTVRRLAVVGGGPGVVVQGASEVSLGGVHVEGAADEGFRIAGGEVSADEVVVDAVTGEASSGIRVLDGGLLRLTGGLVRGGEGTGVEIVDAEATLRAMAVQGSAAGGVALGDGAFATLEGAVVQRTGGSLVSVDCNSGADDCLVMTGSILRGGGSGGVGLELRSGGATVIKTQVSDATGHGVLVDDARADLTDVVVQGTGQTAERTGIGVEVINNGVLDGQRIELRANTNRGLLVSGRSRAQPRDLSVLADLGVTSRGVGIEVRDATLILMGFHVREAGSCGVAIRGDVTVSLNTGVIVGGSAGACVSEADLTVEQLASQVTYRVDDPILVE